ncbi:M28 family peptidase [Balneolaceae bacterium ANBcel3]|nr:M28 family peptidase [Balneolaceae bacterium ANBcel3]
MFVFFSVARTDACGLQKTGIDSLASKHIKESFFNKHLSVLAGEELQGRGTGQKGSALAATYLYDFYSAPFFSEIPHSRLIKQPFDLDGLFWESVTYTLSSNSQGGDRIVFEKRLEPGGAKAFYPVSGGYEFQEGPIVFVGNYHPDSTSLEDSDLLEQSWIMTFCEIADSNSGAGILRSTLIRALTQRYMANGVICMDETQEESWLQNSVEVSRHIARPISIREDGGRYRSIEPGEGSAVYVRPSVAKKILNLQKEHPLDSLKRATQAAYPEIRETGFWLESDPELVERTFTEKNIIYVIDGAESQYHGEYIILSAHYDHLGLGTPDDHNTIIYFGADDNASGTTVVMNVASVVAEAARIGSRPDRTMVFLHTAAEEWGLFGARNFVKETLLNTDKQAVNINVDMVGFRDSKYEESEKEYVYIIGAGLMSTALKKAVEYVNNAYVGLILDEKYNTTIDPYQLYRRSDQWAFGEQDIPFVFFFSGLHDYYHTTRDTYDRLSIHSLVSRTRLITLLAWKLAHVDELPEWDLNIFRLPDTED